METIKEKSYISYISFKDGLFYVMNTLNNGETASIAFPRKSFKTEKGAKKYAHRFLKFSL